MRDPSRAGPSTPYSGVAGPECTAHLAPGCMCPFCATQSSGGHVSITDGVLNPLDDPKFKGKKRTSPVSPIAFAKYK